ncbi:protein archease-like isoform X2 [Dreissena polymorpha]|uniref:protein archease-like isoform X2 n=1 Tax=Dreissena polymorpha TaxID=45954 RepID=UPI0022641BC0|nr:protein archease-like isoform X2 [Dreissena polymorpha]XP_052250964.1 protein archease-like isoform X2 [Dreissena polymorpha]
MMKKIEVAVMVMMMMIRMMMVLAVIVQTFMENTNTLITQLMCSRIHAWGDSLKEAFEQAVQAMFNYMTTDFSTVEMTDEHEVEAQGEDLQSLLFHLMDEWLFAFSAEPYFIAQKIEITEFDTENFRIKAKGYGEEFDISKHPQGTEVKAITYSNMQIHDSDEKHEVFVIIDI